MHLQSYRYLVFGLLVVTGLADAARPDSAGPASDSARESSWQRHRQLQRDSWFQGLPWRSIGPTVQGGRVVDIESIPGDPYGFYVAYATGGVWKTTNNGVSFVPLTDQLATMVTGDIAVDPQHPQRLWVGTGEPNSSRSSYGGMGLFRSDDGGKTFAPAGLAASDRIGRIVVDAENGDRLCVAALGKLYSTGGERGVYCSDDAGAHWTQTLKGETPWTGAIDLVAEPGNPKVLYASTWDRERAPWKLRESGPGSAIYKSIDSGRSWTRLGQGLPAGDKTGRIGLSIAASNPQVLYASIDDWTPLPEALIDLGERPLTLKRLKRMDKAEFLRQDPEEIEAFIRDSDFDTTLDAEALIDKVKRDEVTVAQLVDILEAANDGFGDVDVWGLSVYRSDDGGAHWQRTHERPLADVTYTFGYYFGTIRVAPDNADRVYVVGVPMIGSSDGGKSWTTMQDAKVHSDYHAWWIDPQNSRRMLVGNDGGVDMSYDGGKTWIKLDAQPVGQFYNVTVDMAQPYNVYGGLQDNGSLKGSSTTRWELGQEWSVLPPGCDGMHVAVDTRDNATTYTGCQFGFYLRAGASGRHEVRPRAALTEPKLRYNWNSPIVLSTHNQDIVYFGADRVFRSMDQGETWSAISADLSSNKARGNVPFATVTGIAESPLRFGLLWAGTDDGHLWVTTGGGDRWTAVDAGLVANRWVSGLAASNKFEQRAYVALNGYRNDDIAPYLYVTEDLGKHWTSIAAGLPAEAINVVREDPVSADVLYVGTDRGVYVSLDRGQHWQALQDGLPNVPVHDLVVHPRDRELVAGTHGRSVWVVDVLPVQELTATVQREPVHVFPVEAVAADRDWRSRPPLWFDDSAQLPKLTAPFWVAADGDVAFSVENSDGKVLKASSFKAHRGINTWTWDLLVDRDAALAAERAAPAKPASDSKKDEDRKANKPADTDSTLGTLAKAPYAESVRLGHRLYIAPGKYTLKLTLAGASSETPLEIKAPEPREPRAKKPMKIRGKDGYAGPRPTAEAVGEAHEHD